MSESYLAAEEPAVDLQIAEIMLNELEAYIIGTDLYRTVLVGTSAGDSRMNMSGGDFFARLGRLQGERDALSEDEQARLDQVQTRADEIAYSLQSRFNQRLNQELKSRMDSIRYFLNECGEASGRCREEYPFEMRNRQRITEILRLLGDDADPELLKSLEAVDQRILRISKESPFVWDERLSSVYPQPKYWYLYRRP